MNAEHMKDWAKKHWVLIAAGIAAIYLVSKYFGSSSSASSGTSDAATVAGYNAQIAASNAAAQSTSDQYQLAQNTLAAQSEATTQQAQVANTTAIGSVIGQIGSAISSTIAAQSALPAAAINAVSINNQQALAGAATVAATGVVAVPGIMQAGANQIVASYAPVTAFGSTLVGLSQSIASMGMGAFNAVGSTATGGASAAASSAQTAANANANTSAQLGQLATTAAIIALA